MKSPKFAVAACCLSLSALAALPAQSAVFDIGSMNITAGSFRVWLDDGTVVVNSGSTAADKTITPLTGLGPGINTNLVGGYIGNGGTGTDSTVVDPASVGTANWFGLPVNIYTAAGNLGDTNTPAGTISGGVVPFGFLDDTQGTIVMNLSSWINNWGDWDFNQGTGKGDPLTSPLATGTWDPLTGVYALSWDTSISDAFCSNCSHTRWWLEGVAVTGNPVPVPAAVWLFGTGLLGLLGVARRKG